MLRLILAVFVAAISSQTFATDYGSHNLINMYRSSYNTYNYFSQTIEGGYGNVVFDKGNIGEASDNWKSMNLRSEFGIEALKFFQMSAGFEKTDYSKQGQDDSVMDKYSAFAELKIVLNAPMLNLEVGAGALASTLDIVTGSNFGKYAGSGMYYTAAISRFLNSRLSIFARGSTATQHFTKDSGELEHSTIDFEGRNIGFGIRLYL